LGHSIMGPVASNVFSIYRDWNYVSLTFLFCSDPDCSVHSHLCLQDNIILNYESHVSLL
jgi:hypothetical protein